MVARISRVVAAIGLVVFFLGAFALPWATLTVAGETASIPAAFEVFGPLKGMTRTVVEVVFIAGAFAAVVAVRARIRPLAWGGVATSSLYLLIILTRIRNTMAVEASATVDAGAGMAFEVIGLGMVIAATTVWLLCTANNGAQPN